MNKLWSLIMTLAKQIEIYDAALAAGAMTQTEYDNAVAEATAAHDAAVELAKEEARKKKLLDDIRDATGATKYGLVVNYAVNQRISAAFDRLAGNDYDSRMKNRFASDLTRAVRSTSSSFTP